MQALCLHVPVRCLTAHTVTHTNTKSCVISITIETREFHVYLCIYVHLQICSF